MSPSSLAHASRDASVTTWTRRSETEASAAKRGRRAASTPPVADGEADGDDPKSLKRRQYKLYQRRHRARQREKMTTLEAQVAQLSREIASLAATLETAVAVVAANDPNRGGDRNHAPADELAGEHTMATPFTSRSRSITRDTFRSSAEPSARRERELHSERSPTTQTTPPPLLTPPSPPSPPTLPTSSAASSPPSPPSPTAPAPTALPTPPRPPPPRGVSVRYTLAGAPARLVREYLRRFEHGYVFKHRRAQEAFVRAMVTSDVRGPRVDGADQLLEQWRRYDQVFAMVHVATNAMTVERIDAQQTAVVVGVTLRLRLRRGGALSLFPSLDAGEEGEARRRAVLDRLVGDLLVVDGSLRFVVERCDRVSWLGARMDFVAALARATGSFATACACLDGALLDASTGFLRCEHDAVGLSDRHELSFILC